MLKQLHKYFIYFSTLSMMICLNANSEPPATLEINQVVLPSKEKLSNLYSPYFLHLLQIIYGTEGIISQGGPESIDKMFKGIDLNGKNILDIGCGFGGVDVYLAQQYQAEIVGFDCEPYMILEAQKQLEQKKDSLIGKVNFQVLKEKTTLEELPSHSFDIIFSKEMLYHVQTSKKQQYIREMYRVLKPGGILIIADWLQGTPTPGEHLKQAVRVDGFCYFVTSQEVQNMMIEANFQNITFEDITVDHIRYTREDINRIKNAISQIQQELGEGTYERGLEAWNLWLKAQETGELVAGIFIARKT